MKTLQKALSLILALAMIFGLAACAKDTTGPDSNPDPTVAPTEEPVESPDVEEPEEYDPNKDPNHPTSKYEPIDMGGRVFTFAYNWDFVPSSTDYEINPETDGADVIRYLENMKRIEEKYNCKIQTINLPWDQRVEKITSTVMANAPVADGVLLDVGQILPLAAQGLLLAYDDFVPANADVFNAQLALVPGGELMGKQYAVDIKQLPSNGFFMGVNLDIINDLGLESPVDLYNKGEWNWESFLNIARAATKDTNQDGEIDQFGLSGAPYEIMFQLIAANDGYLFDGVNKKQGFDNPNTLEAIKFFTELYNTEKVGYMPNGLDDWTANRNAFLEGKSALFMLQSWVVPDGDAGPSFNFAVVPTPVGPNNTSGATWAKSAAGMCIPKGVQNPEWVYMIYEEMNAMVPEDYEVKEEGTRDWLAGKFQTEEDIQRIVDLSGKGFKVDNYYGIPTLPIWYLTQTIVNDNKTAAQAVEELKQVAQDAIDEFFSGLE